MFKRKRCLYEIGIFFTCRLGMKYFQKIVKFGFITNYIFRLRMVRPESFALNSLSWLGIYRFCC